MSNVFYRFKMGISNLAFPLALGIYRALQKRKMLDFDCIVPIPLSPDKARAGEINRTLLLAQELSKLLGTDVIEGLSLSGPISKHGLRTGLGLSAATFELRYGSLLCVSDAIKSRSRILLIDDVCTEGSTLRSAVNAIKSVNTTCELVAGTAGQMILKSVVIDDSKLGVQT